MELAVVAAVRFHDDAPDAELAEPDAVGAAADAGVGEAALERGSIDEDVDPVVADVGLGGRCHVLLGIPSTGLGNPRGTSTFGMRASAPTSVQVSWELLRRAIQLRNGARLPLGKTVRPAARQQAGRSLLSQSPPVSEHPAAPRSLSAQHKKLDEVFAAVLAVLNCRIGGSRRPLSQAGSRPGGGFSTRPRKYFRKARARISLHRGQPRRILHFSQEAGHRRERCPHAARPSGHGLTERLRTDRPTLDRHALTTASEA